MKRLVDSNVLVYAFDIAEENKHTIAKNLVAELIRENNGVVSIQNLSEFSYILTEKAKIPLDHHIVRATVLRFQEALDVLIYSSNTIADALSISATYRLHFFDALIAATMEENHISEIITENEKDFSKIPWIKVINPFKK